MKLENAKRWLIGLIYVLVFNMCSREPLHNTNSQFLTPKVEFSPQTYVVYKTDEQITVDGKLNENAWGKAKWTNYFVDIEGKDNTKKETRAKIIWDRNFLYVAAELKENDVWATMKKRNSPLFLDNAFEIFIDPDGDTHNYLEFEINAFSTIWDLLLTRPGRDDGYSFSNFNMLNLHHGVNVQGSINDPRDEDKNWTLEVAFPLEGLQELKPNNESVKAGDQWRIQLARAQRDLVVVDGKYELKTKPNSDQPSEVQYTSWTPQGLINLHYPEMWGFIQFSNKVVGEGISEFDWKKQEEIKWVLRKIYYKLKEYKLKHNSYTENISKLDLENLSINGEGFEPKIQVTESMFEVVAEGIGNNKTWVINHNGKVWSR